MSEAKSETVFGQEHFSNDWFNRLFIFVDREIKRETHHGFCRFNSFFDLYRSPGCQIRSKVCLVYQEILALRTPCFPGFVGPIFLLDVVAAEGRAIGGP